MTSASDENLLKRNVKLLAFYKIFTKRVFLPLITVYSVQRAGMTIRQLGIAFAAAAVTNLVLDTYSGYWADEHGRKKSAQLGSLLAALGSLIYVLSTNFWGIMLASMTVAAGYSFINGSAEALIHDSLRAMGKANDYSKVVSRAQSLALIINAGLLATVPLLYPIDQRLPFAVGVLSFMTLFVISYFLTEPKIVHNDSMLKFNFYQSVRFILNRKTVGFFGLLGFIYATGTSTNDVFILGFLKLGLNAKYLGFILAASSLLGAVIGFFIHHLKKLSFKQFAAVDFSISVLPFLTFGLTGSLVLATITYVLGFAFWRYEQILYQHYILQLYGDTKYKATIISLSLNFRSLNELWVALAVTSAAKHFGILNSLTYDAIFILGILPIFLLMITRFTKYVTVTVPKNSNLT